MEIGELIELLQRFPQGSQVVGYSQLQILAMRSGGIVAKAPPLRSDGSWAFYNVDAPTETLPWLEKGVQHVD